MKLTQVTVDDFYPAPMAVRMAAKTLNYQTVEYQGHKYNGIGVGYVPERVDEYLSKVIGSPVELKENYFRLGTSLEMPTSYIHADNALARFACVWYLSDCPDSVVGGTAFWRNKELGITQTPTLEEVSKYSQFKGDAPVGDRYIEFINEQGMDEGKWDMIGLVGHKFNRLTIYPTEVFHSRFPKEGWGKNVTDGRLVWTGFFNLKS